MKLYMIYDSDVGGNIVTSIKARTERSALKKFRSRLFSTGFYELIRENNSWVLASSYGAYYRAEVDG